MSTMTTFHPFLRLPAELRAHIWDLTVEPRIVEVRVIHHQPKAVHYDKSLPEWKVKQPPPMRHLRSSTPVPAPLQTCRESRAHFSNHSDPRYRYEKAFSIITTWPNGGYDAVPENDPESKRYVWFNFDLDIFSIGDTDLSNYGAVAYQIRRLRLARFLGNEYFDRTESLLIPRLFTEIAELYIVCLNGIRAGYSTYEDFDLPCGPESLYFVDPEEQGGSVINSIDLDALVISESEEVHGLIEEDDY